MLMVFCTGVMEWWIVQDAMDLNKLDFEIKGTLNASKQTKSQEYK